MMIVTGGGGCDVTVTHPALSIYLRKHVLHVHAGLFDLI